MEVRLVGAATFEGALSNVTNSRQGCSALRLVASAPRLLAQRIECDFRVRAGAEMRTQPQKAILRCRSRLIIEAADFNNARILRRSQNGVCTQVCRSRGSLLAVPVRHVRFRRASESRRRTRLWPRSGFYKPDIQTSSPVASAPPWDRIQAVHQRPPCGTKKQSSTPVNLLMKSTGV